jgi:hypothetical protein
VKLNVYNSNRFNKSISRWPKGALSLLDGKLDD